MSAALWRVAGKSVRGDSHRRRGLPNQDAILWRAEGNLPVVLAVADGHGSSNCYRSGTGAALAVRAAAEVLGAIPEDSLEELDGGRLARDLVARWREAVAEHWARNPVEDGPAREKVPWNVYGSTLLAVLATATHLLYLQIGDGDILIVSGTGEAVRPWERDPRCFGVETTSLCSRGAEADTRVQAIRLDAHSPALVLLSTDGYANSFREDAGFRQIGRDILEIIREEGLEKVDCELEGWLAEASESGSGDDITMGILWRSGTGEAGNGE